MARPHWINPLRDLSTPGLLVGTLFFAFSLTPSLVPRPFWVQGVVSGLSLAAGYAIGFLGYWLWHYLEIPLPRRRAQRRIKLLAAGACALVAAIFLWRASDWQNSVRAIMQMEPVAGGRPLSVASIALLVFALLLLIARLFYQTFLLLSWRLNRFVPRRVAKVAGMLAAVVLFWLVINGVIFRFALRVADRSYQQMDAVMMDGLPPPTEPLKTGSSASFIPWNDLGQAGRAFISTGPTASDLAAFHGETTPEPIRVYVGLNAAATPRDRARLALEELKRVNAFDRSVLVLITPTGTGWVDSAAIDPLEYVLRGDVASVAAQYSYLPSALSLIVEGEYGAETARAMFEAIYGHWTQLPHDSRPALYLFGLSLGALNSDLSFDAYDIVADPFDGVLWVGPPFRSESWRTITAGRVPDSPQWLPRFRDGSVVRFMNQHGTPHSSRTPWGPLRILYLQYASDPITFFSVQSFYREPQWMREPRGPDVSPHLRWYPIVTSLQLVADMVVGGAPPGYGHEYAAEDYLDAWLALMEPANWSSADTGRLRALLTLNE